MNQPLQGQNLRNLQAIKMKLYLSKSSGNQDETFSNILLLEKNDQTQTQQILKNLQGNTFNTAKLSIVTSHYASLADFISQLSLNSSAS